MSNLPSYADVLASQAAECLIEIGDVLARGDLPVGARVRLETVRRTLPGVVNGLDYLAASIALAGQVLRRGPERPAPDRHLARRLDELAAVGLPPTAAEVEPVGTSSPLV